jgi:hypothetical protein
MPAHVGDMAAHNLTTLANGLAERPDLRTTLANTVSKANGHCEERVAVNFGQLMLAQEMDNMRQPDVRPDQVVLTVLQHAATRAATAFAHQLVGPGAEPSAELMIAMYHFIQERLRAVGIEQYPFFPFPVRHDPKDARHYPAVIQWGNALTAGLLNPRLLGPQKLHAGATVDLLTQHGGTEFEEIFSSRLAHHIKPAMEPLLFRAEQLQANKDKLPDQDYMAHHRQLIQDSQDVRRKIYEKAVLHAIHGTGAMWEVPARPAPA